MYPYEECHKNGLNGFKNFCESKLGLSDSESLKTYEKARKIINERLHGQAASHSRLLYAKEFCELLELNPVVYAKKLEECYWSSFLEHIELRPNVFHFLERLKIANKRLALVTDLTTEIQLKKLNLLGIGSFFDVIVTSEEAGREKPDPKIFELALYKLKAVKSECVMIGDNYEKDVLGARTFGIDAIQFGRSDRNEIAFNNFQEAFALFYV